MLHGAIEDKTLPEPHVADDGESWEVVEDRSQFEDVAVFADGQSGENAASFERTATVGYVLALNQMGRNPKTKTLSSQRWSHRVSFHLLTRISSNNKYAETRYSKRSSW